MRSHVTDNAKSDRDHEADPETQTQAGSFLCSVTVSNIDHEALDGPRVFHQPLTFRGAQNVLSLSGGSASIRRDFCSFSFFSYFLLHLTVIKRRYLFNSMKQ